MLRGAGGLSIRISRLRRQGFRTTIERSRILLAELASEDRWYWRFSGLWLRMPATNGLLACGIIHGVRYAQDKSPRQAVLTEELALLSIRVSARMRIRKPISWSDPQHELRWPSNEATLRAFRNEIRRLLVSQQLPPRSTATSRLYRPCRSARSLHSQ